MANQTTKNQISKIKISILYLPSAVDKTVKKHLGIDIL